MSKGSAPRKNRDDEAYARGWDAIFSRKKTTEKRKCTCDPQIEYCEICCPFLYNSEKTDLPKPT